MQKNEREELEQETLLGSNTIDNPGDDNSMGDALGDNLLMVEVIRSKYNYLWYRKFKGEVFAVTYDHPKYYRVLVEERELAILKTDCKPIYDQD